ncbi:MAG: hypothetical protein EHM20_16705, partial [Alphaproteobacteria bacterium]
MKLFVKGVLVFLVTIFLTSFNLNFVTAGTYGEGDYGGGEFNVGVTPSPVPTTTTSITSNSDSSGIPVCTQEEPKGLSTWIYSAVSNSSSSVTIKFTNWQSPVDHFTLEYGTKSGEYKYSVDGISKDSTSFLIEKLNANTSYYFRIRSGNGCAVGSWSNEISALTKSHISLNNLEITESTLEPFVTDEVGSRQDLRCQTYTVKPGDSLWGIAANLL